ncbi:hypothetical protein GOBAR_AA15694 [Gossypium barbadense]|uniref:Uncharacterized protein n=1 Tax=Gossypium barbadense TaxID=3634 RepID=A0A2P5XNR4_GOSBA|nr:hypothetical protein GOBAR_AA15694 [Gossypium barbadense]
MKNGVLDIQENDEDDVQLLEEDFTIGTEDGLSSIRIMDLENDYFLIKLQSEEDYVRALPEGIPGFMYRKNVLKSIREMIDRVIKLDDNIESAQRGRFARLAVVLDLNKPLISRIKESYYNPSERGHSGEDISASTSNMQPQVQGENHDVVEKYGPWMLVNQCPRKSDQKTGIGASLKGGAGNLWQSIRWKGGKDSNMECELLHVDGLDWLGQTNEPTPFISSDKDSFPQTVVQDLSTAINPSRLMEKKAKANGRALVHSSQSEGSFKRVKKPSNILKGKGGKFKV